MPNSKLKVEIARILKEEGYIRDYHVSDQARTRRSSSSSSTDRPERVLSGLKRVSKPGRRIYAGKTAASACRRHGHRHHVHLPRRHHEPHCRSGRDRGEDHLLRLVTAICWRKSRKTLTMNQRPHSLTSVFPSPGDRTAE